MVFTISQGHMFTICDLPRGLLTSNGGKPDSLINHTIHLTPAKIIKLGAIHLMTASLSERDGLVPTV